MKTILTIIVASLVLTPAIAAPLEDSTDAPAWVGTVLSGSQIERPELCQKRGGVAHQQAYTMSGNPLARRKDRDGPYWVGKTGNMVVAWYRGRYVSFKRRATLVAVWCRTKRPPRDNTVIIEPDGGWHWADGNGPNSDPTP
jgi:hypothetical protein